MHSAKTILRSACLGAFAILSAGIVQANAGQQKWASQYVNWKSDGQVAEALNVDQQVWIPKTNDGSYWPLTWGFTGVNYGGYMGLQQTNANEQNVRFSIWNATEAKGTSCRPFGNEGVGHTCVLPVKIDTGKFYRLRLLKLETAPDGQWWGGWLIETDRSGALVEHLIGQIKAPAAATSVKPNSLRNFVEFYGGSVATCDRVPLSIAAFSPPAINYNGKGTATYKAYTNYTGSKPAKGNLCATGKESVGAAVTATPYSFQSTDGVMMFLGGTPSQHKLDAKTQPMPKAMPYN